MALSIRENGASISVGELPVVRGDRNQLERLFRKLLSSAIKYRHHDRALQVHVQAALAGDYWNLSFVDNGLGIPSHCHDKVFEPLQRLHRQEEVVGTGLGLSICRQIAHPGFAARFRSQVSQPDYSTRPESREQNSVAARSIVSPGAHEVHLEMRWKDG